MKQIQVGLLFSTILISLMAGYPFSGVEATEWCEEWVARVVSIQGDVQALKAGETRWSSVSLNDTYCTGAMISARERSRAAIVLRNESVLRLGQNTTITFMGQKKEQTLLLRLLRGVALFFSRTPRALEVTTPFVNAAAEGTEFYVHVEPDQTFLTIFDGRLAVTNEVGSLMLTSGNSAVAEAGKAPTLRVVVRPRDAVQWALYYPPVIYFRPDEVPEDIPDPRFFTYRASRLLVVGRVDEAGADIQRALSLDPKYSDAYALQSIIAVVQNEKEKALNSAQKAIEGDPNSATARIALSYAQQAGFDLEGARASIEEAVKLDPDNALAYARLAELWSSFGRLSKALDAAKNAVELDPNQSRTQMVLGFAYLAQVKTKESKTAFEKAIELDQADPLSRLGLGLAKIRNGDLEEGGREVEIAAGLDPNNSLVRSYLGKVYFEEKRTGLDEREYAIAKELDPSDPTPWFYDAIAKQTTNRPVEALHNLQKAKELNDNRVVYRSRLLLDSDLASRSASLARIYSDLGFQQRALVEGWKWVNTDPSNFSPHRFLADSLSVLPRHEIARVSELLQSQLLQPINITPIQPGLAEGNLFLISAGGPANLSFREFNPLFNRNRIAFQGSGIIGENSTYGGEGIVSGIYDKFSFSGGYTHFETDGWRKNVDLNDDITNIFGQMELTYKTSIQAEYRYRDTERGDTQLRFFKDDFSSNLDQEDETKTARFGFRHVFSPGSTLIGNFSYQNADRKLNEVLEDFFSLQLEVEEDDDVYGGELQHLYSSQYINLSSGLGYFDTDSKFDFSIKNNIPVFKEVLESDLKHANVYAYFQIKPLKNLAFTVGASYDSLDVDDDSLPGGGKGKDQFNPKFGIIWNPFSDTTLRAAAFRTFNRTLISNQTLESTQVAGFNQFFDDINGTEAWRYGGAVDQKFSESIYAGAEYAYRDLNVPFLSLFPERVENANWDEKIFRAYFYWTPHSWLALSAEYLYEDFERDEDFAFDARDVETHYVPFGINFFHPSGLSAGLKVTYVDQDGEFERISNVGVFENGDDSFWLFDAAINYRLPKRYGFITVGVTNLFDEDFEHFDTDITYEPDSRKPLFVTPRIQPDRSVFLKITLAF